MTLFSAIRKPFSPEQRLAVFTLFVAAVFLLSSSHTSTFSILTLALAAIAVAVWHGAFDGVLARPLLRPRFGHRWWPVFLVSYLAMIGGVAVLWCLWPTVALPLFLVYSAWHFGAEAGDWKPTALSAAGAFCRGALPIAAACLWHQGAVIAIFATMMRSGGQAASLIAYVAGLLLLPILGILLLASIFQPTHRYQILLLSTLEILLFWRATPVLAFAIFFCCWHTPEHLVASGTSPSGRVSTRTMLLQLRSGLLPWIVSLAGLALLVLTSARQVAAVASSVFIVLSALTVPHMLLNELRRSTSIRLPVRHAAGGVHAR